MKNSVSLKPFLHFFAVVMLAFILNGCAAKQSERDYKHQDLRVGGSTSQHVLKSAQAQVGRPYRLGGDSPQRGFDCSGLIYWAFKQHGISVPRQTTDQAKAGKSVSRKRLQPGDIVVFRTPGAPNGLHTGLYAGEGKFIHSPNSKSVVRVESMTPYWQDRYLTGRRVLAAEPKR